MNRFSSHGPDSGVHGVPPARSPPTAPASPRSSGAALEAPRQATAQGPSGERGWPWLSVVIPTRNTPDLTLGCLASLQEAGSGVEVIVVDDASSDGALDAVEQSFPVARVVRRQTRGGFSAAANQGLRRARGDVLLLLNSDTEVDEGALRSLRERFARQPRLGIAGGLLRYPDGTPQWSGGSEPTLPWLFVLATGIGPLLAKAPFYRRFLPVGGHGRAVTWVPGAAMAIRRETWEAAGPLDESFSMYCQDLDFCLRASELGWTTELVEELGVVHHHGATIGRSTGIAAHQDLVLLWADLVRWAGKHRGERWRRQVQRTLCWGGRMRLGCRYLVRGLLRPGARVAWNRDTQILRRAIRRAQNGSPPVTNGAASR